MSPGPVLAAFARLRTRERDGQRAPHKPLLVLLALDHWARGDRGPLRYGARFDMPESGDAARQAHGALLLTAPGRPRPATSRLRLPAIAQVRRGRRSRERAPVQSPGPGL